MLKLIQRAADRMVSAVVPKVEAQAPPCDCNPGETWWGEYCYCDRPWLVYRLYTCNGNCVGATSRCVRRFNYAC